MEKIREQNKAGFDSLQTALNYENNLHLRIKENINIDDYKTALILIDTLFILGKTDFVHLYKGMIYEKQSDYSKAIGEYNIAIGNGDFPLALVKRGDAYRKLNKPYSAINDYEKAFRWNFDNSLQIASIYELINKKDSALKYYHIYMEHYPNDTMAQQKILLLSR